MILLDALHVNSGGGKVLLDYLVEELEQSGIDVFYLFDDRCKNDFHYIPIDRKVYLKASIRSRFYFYKHNKNNFSKVFCFGNFPPPIKLGIKAYTFFHNILILNIPKNYTFKNKIKSYLRKEYFKFLLKNTDSIIVQSKFVKNSFRNLYRKNDILIFPFFEEFKFKNRTEKKHQFLYVASFLPHKNHTKLFEAWELLATMNMYPELHLTLKNIVEVENLIKELANKGIKIINHGYMNKTKLSKLYSESKYLIYPSLTESFGLPLIEACAFNCNIIASDLDYVHQVIQPSLTFNPFSAESIAYSVKECELGKIPETKQKVKNKIQDIINLLN